jgi:hypothetical protein
MLLECDHCQAIVDAELLEAYDVHDAIAPSFRISFAKCPRCSSPFLATQEEDFPEGWQHPQRLYPSEESPTSSALPKPIREAVEEANRCLRVRAYTAAAIMCRKALEGICVEHGVKERNLSKSLEEMRDKGIIEKRLFDWADALRISGNEAAHDVYVTVSAEDARDILDFTNALTEYVFTFRDKFETFQKRRQQRAQDQ